MLEAMMGVAVASGRSRTRTGPKEPAMREARVCYDHLAGRHAVALLRKLNERGAVAEDGGDLILTDAGAATFEAFGVDLVTLRRARRPVCRSCLDWSERRFHLGGGLGAAIFAAISERGWAVRDEGSRIVQFTCHGLSQFREAFGLHDLPSLTPS